MNLPFLFKYVPHSQCCKSLPFHPTQLEGRFLGGIEGLSSFFDCNITALQVHPKSVKQALTHLHRSPPTTMHNDRQLAMT